MSKKDKELKSSRKYVIIGGIFTLSFLGIAAACCYFATNTSEESISAQTFTLLRNARLSLVPRRFRASAANADRLNPVSSIIDDLPEPAIDALKPEEISLSELPNVPERNEDVNA